MSEQVSCLKLANWQADANSLNTILQIFPNLIELDLNDSSFCAGPNGASRPSSAKLTTLKLPEHTRIEHENER